MGDVALALRNSSKGQLKYDRFWVEEGRTKEILDGISKYSTKISVSISPGIFPAIISENATQVSKVKTEVPSSNSKQDSTKEKPKPIHSMTDVHFFELQSEMEQPIQEYEEERQRYIQSIFENKKSEFENHILDVEKQIRQEYNLAKRKNELDARRRTGELQKLEESMMREAHEVGRLQKEQHQSHVKKLSAKILEAELKQKQAEEDLKRRLKEQEEFKAQLNTCLSEAKSFVNKSVEKLTLCEYQEHLTVPLNERIKQPTALLQYINDIDRQSKDKELTIDDILNANFQVQRAYVLLQEISSDIDSAKVKASHHKEVLTNSISSLENNNLKKNEVEQSLDSNTTTNQDIEIEISSEASSVRNKDPNKDEKKIISRFIAPDAVHFYQKVMNDYKRVDAIVESVRKDPKNKKYRFELQKAVNTPINSLSSNSGSQIKTKVNKLLSILTGKASETSGRNMNGDSPIFNFCAYLAAKQFVEQGDTQISSQHSTAFPIAFAALGVWVKQPEFGQLLLGHFYDKCPYLAPYYPPKEESQSDEEYFQSLGYRLDDEDKIEPKYKFLHRISGYVRLYAAIIQSPLPPGVSSPHPHGIEWGWKWLSRMLNLEPRPDITPTVLFDFLDVAGYALQKAYGKQFNKMLHILCKDYFQKIKQVTPGGSGGPLERLEIFLQQCAKKGRISPPEGILSANFWSR